MTKPSNNFTWTEGKKRKREEERKSKRKKEKFSDMNRLFGIVDDCNNQDPYFCTLLETFIKIRVPGPLGILGI